MIKNKTLLLLNSRNTNTFKHFRPDQFSRLWSGLYGHRPRTALNNGKKKQIRTVAKFTGCGRIARPDAATVCAK